VVDNLSENEGAAIVGSALNREQRAVRAQDEWYVAEDGDEAVVTQAGLCENVLASRKNDGGCEESRGWRLGRRCGRVGRHGGGVGSTMLGVCTAREV